MSRHPLSASADYENMLSAVRASGASQRELASAFSIIAKLEKRLTAERKRREECEAVLREVARAPNRIAENSRIIADYFSHYEGAHERKNHRG